MGGFLAVVVFDFDPVGTILGIEVRWQFAAVAAIIFVALVLAAAIAVVAERRSRAGLAADPERPAAIAEAVRAAEETIRSTAPAGPPGMEAQPVPAAAGMPPGATTPGSVAAAPAPEDGAAPAPVDPVYPGWTPGRTVPHVAVASAVVAASVRAPAPDPPLASALVSPPGSDATATDAPAPSAPAPEEAAPAAAPGPPDAPAPPDEERPWPVGLRLDDLIFIVAGATAGAVVVGRLGWVLLYWNWYREHASSILDPSVGGLTLAGGVVGGILAGLLMALVLGAPVARWLGVAVVPLLAALAAGKLAMILGGEGQGLPYEGPWATAYAGPGPWGSLAPMIPSYPAQAYEGFVSAAVLVVVLLLALVPSMRRHPAALFAVGIGAWAVGRFAVASLWRDPALVGGLNGDQLVTGGIAIVALLALVAIAVHSRLQARASAATPGTATAAAA